MPLDVTIAINGRPIHELHIGRLEGGVTDDSVNTYAVVEVTPPRIGATADRVSNRNWDEAPKFEHRYGDGAERCVELALETLRKKSE